VLEPARPQAASTEHRGGFAAERTLAIGPEALFEFLSDLENHWALADRFVEVVELERDNSGRPATGGRVRLRGPLGLRRTAATRVVDVQRPSRIAGTALLGRGTLALVSWTVDPHGEGTRVRLAAKVERASALDRVLLAVGGRRWLRRRFAKILATLDAHVLTARLESAL
jgi:uncharacterized protein YndB with AHSA1/START domain